MLYLIYGTDTSKKQIARERIISKYGNENVSIMHRTGDTLSQEELEQAAGSTSLFGERIICVLEYPFENEIFANFLIKILGELQSSENIFIVFERELPKDTVSRFEKADAECFLCDEPKQGKKKEFNIFSITDALQGRDKKKTWLIYREAVEHEHEPEAIHGTLFWSVKNMLLLVGVSGTAGLNPFVAGKSRAGLMKWKKEELENLSRKLVHLSHEAHSGTVEFEEGLEQLILESI